MLLYRNVRNAIKTLMEVLTESLETQLLSAVQCENVTKVLHLIENGVNVNNFPKGRTPLSIAAKLGNIEIVELLLKKRSDTGAVSKRKKAQGNNAYYVFVHQSKDEVIEDITPEGMECLEWDTEEIERDSAEEDSDIWANQYRWYADVLARTCPLDAEPDPVPQAGADVNLRDSSGRVALHFASEAGHDIIVELLLRHGAWADVADDDGITPLHLAAARGHSSLCTVLVSAGAHVDSRTSDSMTPLHYAASREHVDAVNELIRAGANVDALDSTDRTPLKLAASRNLLPVIDLLIAAGARVDIEDNKGYTALCEAVWQKSVSAASALVAAGARVKPTNYLVHYATVHRHAEMVHLLVEAGAVVNIRDSLGLTPLIAAALTDQPHLINFLIDNGAVVNYYWERTPLSAYVASRSGQRTDIVDTLLRCGADAVRASHHDAPLAMAIVCGKLIFATQLVATGAVPPETRFTHPSYEGADAMRLVLQLIGEHPAPILVQLAETLILAGYNVNKLGQLLSGVGSNCQNPLLQLLIFRKSNPLALAELSRIAVRRSAPELLPSWISTLGLPPALVSYVLMDERVALSAESSIIK